MTHKPQEFGSLQRQLEGLNRNAGTHAAGVVISNEPLWHKTPLFKPSGQDTLATQYSGKYVEDVDLIKFDFLGLKTLTVVEEALKLVKERHGVEINFKEIGSSPDAYSKHVSNRTVIITLPSSRSHETIPTTAAQVSPRHSRQTSSPQRVTATNSDISRRRVKHEQDSSTNKPRPETTLGRRPSTRPEGHIHCHTDRGTPQRGRSRATTADQIHGATPTRARHKTMQQDVSQTGRPHYRPSVQHVRQNAHPQDKTNRQNGNTSRHPSCAPDTRKSNTPRRRTLEATVREHPDDSPHAAGPSPKQKTTQTSSEPAATHTTRQQHDTTPHAATREPTRRARKRRPGRHRDHHGRASRQAPPPQKQ